MGAGQETLFLIVLAELHLEQVHCFTIISFFLYLYVCKVATLGKEARVEDMGDLSTLADPLAVEDLIASIAAATTSSSASRSDTTTNFKPLFRGPFLRANKA
jgi:hypothetical protein